MWKIIVFILLGVVGLAIVAWDWMDRIERPKREWGVLQVIHGKGGLEPMPDRLLFEAVHGYSVVGILAGDSSERVWVLLNSESEPYYKQMPVESRYSLSRSELELIRGREVVSATVLAVLESHVEPMGRPGSESGSH